MGWAGILTDVVRRTSLLDFSKALRTSLNIFVSIFGKESQAILY
jgi:hypothetical protein